MHALGFSLGQFCLTYRKSILAVLGALTLLAMGTLSQMRFNNALDNWFVEDDPALLAHQRLIDTFTSDDIIVIGYAAPDVFDPEVLALIDRLSERLESAPHVEKVFSLTRVESIEGRGDALEIDDLVRFPLDPDSLPSLRKRVLSNPLYVGNVVSAAGDFTVLVARLPHRGDDFEYKIEAISAIREILAEQSGHRFYMAGGAVLDEVLFEYSDIDARNSTAIMIVGLIVILAFLLRSVAGVVLPLATVVVSVVWAYAAIVLSGRPLNAISTMLPPLLLAVGVADSLHYLVDYQNRLRAGSSQRDALLESYAELLAPMTLTSATTAIGMTSLLVSHVQAIREFGMFGALGVVGAFVLSITFVPIVASYLRPMADDDPDTDDPDEDKSGWLTALHELTLRRGGAIVCGFALIVVGSAVAATHLKAESAFLEFFRDGDPIKVDTRRIEAALSGTLSVEVIVDSGAEGGIKEPDFLARVDAMQDFLESRPTISSSLSVTDSLKDMRRAMHGGDDAAYKLPETRPEAGQYLLLYEMDAPDGDINDMITFDHRAARISARMNTTTSANAIAVVEAAEARAAQLFPPPAHAEVTGLAVLYANMDGYIRTSLIRGFSIALVAIFAVLCLHMRSVVLGAVAMIPNAVPILMCLGFMGATGIRLDTMTVMVASITIGLAVDDTIHFVARVRVGLDKGLDMVEALRTATLAVGRALVYTSVCLFTGFASMLTGHLVGTVNFGLLCLLTIVFALAADLLLMPVLLRWFGGPGGVAETVTDAASAPHPRADPA